MGFPEILAQHQLCLNVGFVFEGGLEAELGFDFEGVLGDAERFRRPARQLRRQRPRLRQHLRFRHDAIVQADLVRPVRIHKLARQQQLAGASVSDDAGQEPGGPHVGAGEADLGEEKRDFRGFRGHADVARRGDHRARAGRRAVHGPDDRPPAAPHRENQIAREPRELLERFQVAPQQRADDVLDVAARTKRAPRAGDDDRAHLGLGIQPPKRVAQLGIDLEGERIQPLGPIERNRRDVRLHPIADSRRPIAHRTATASISTSACESMSDFTSSTAMAG